MSITKIAEHPRVHLAGAAVSAVGEVISWFTTFGDKWQITPIAFILTVVFMGLFALGQYTEAERLREEKRPKFDMIFLPDEDAHPDSRPYLQVLRFRGNHLRGVERDRRYRVGIVNLSSAVLPKVEVILASCTPGGNFIHPAHQLLVTDTDPPRGERDLPVSLSGEPTAYFDVVAEVGPDTGPPEYFAFQYANPNLRGPVTKQIGSDEYEYVITLRAQGANYSCVRTFRVSKGWDERRSQWIKLKMEPL